MEREEEERLQLELEERQRDQEMDVSKIAESESVNKDTEEEPTAKQTGALPKEFECPECEKKFRSSQLVKSHIKTVHRKKKAKEVNTATENEQDSTKKKSSRNRLLSITFNCDTCDKVFESQQQVKAHIEVAHKKNQITLDGRAQLTNAPPQNQRKIVIVKPSGKLMWPAEVISESEGAITVQLFNKTRSIKTIKDTSAETFNYDEHSKYISANNSEHKHAFKMAKSATELTNELSTLLRFD